ncbi:MAG TPA: ATP-dependent DNA helicase RecQ [Flavobacterium sp.]
MTPQEILKQYWQHDSFRNPQEEIIASVLEGKDTFALMPTGGGKSVCFQIPGMIKEGICLVISPLVALMKDQVSHLEKRNIKAIALTGGIAQDEMIALLDNCQYGNYKFLYLSPERLQSDWIMDRIKSLPVNLIAIDEAHCVSQWGHDFRPAYLKIANLKPHFPKTPILALTASATKRVQEDIIVQLHLNEPAIFQKSFERENIAYMVFNAEDKLYKMGQILKKNPQSSIVYVRNRKSCLDVASQLQALGFKATYYHGGLSTKEKDKNMQLWINEEIQVMVATNAFGMGIDKANVKTVIHIQLPENIENYYQEAGRAGRNGEKAFAALLTSPADSIQAESQFIHVLPDKKFLTLVYVKLCNYFQIAYGEGIDEQFSFNLNHFCTQYQFPIVKTFNAIQFLDRQGIISLSQEFSEKAIIQFIIPSKEVIRYISLNPQDEAIILNILRNYAGIYDVATALNTAMIAKKSGTTEAVVLELLQKLKDKQIIDYKAKKNDATIIFNEIREDEKTINRVSKYLENKNKLKKMQLQSVLNYIQDKNNCKSQLILAYFGETKKENCGICSYCIALNKKSVTSASPAKQILDVLSNHDLDSREIQNILKLHSNDIIFAIQNLLENNVIVVKPNNKYTLKK